MWVNDVDSTVLMMWQTSLTALTNRLGVTGRLDMHTLLLIPPGGEDLDALWSTLHALAGSSKREFDIDDHCQGAYTLKEAKYLLLHLYVLNHS